jgi:transcriptional regulator with GAF, ATPase, and Fis domain
LADPKVNYNIEHRVVRPDGSERIVAERGDITLDEAGRPVRMIGTVQDITERKQTELKLRNALDDVERLKDRLSAENVYLQEELKGLHEFDEIIGQSQPLRMALHKVHQVAGTGANVLLSGETGTGKELFARAIHNHSSRKDKPLVKVNCAALPSNLIESELFGHVKGAFTGALSDRTGRFELADGRTLFLDEVGELDINLQTKLLRVLQEGEFVKTGTANTIQVDVRVVAATNRDLEEAMDEGDFRPELYYRLAVFPIHVPPLRERCEDIPVLVRHFITKKKTSVRKNIETIPEAVMQALIQYDWPGNVRELENVIERAMLLSPGSVLAPDDLFLAPTQPLASEGAASSLEDIERTHIRRILEACNWRIKGTGGAAEQLGMKPSTLRYRMQKLGIARG